MNKQPSEFLVAITAITLALVVFAAWAFIVSGFGATLEARRQPAFDAGRVTVGVTATPIYVAPQRGGAVRVCNRHTTPIFVGPIGVTTANGFEILNATCEDFRAYPKATIYGIVATATARVDYAAGYYAEP